LIVEPDGLLFSVGSTWPYTATASYGDGTNSDVTQSSDWSSSNAGVAIVSNTNDSSQGKGLATAIAPGTTTIQAVQGGQSDAVTLEITDECESSSSNGKPDTVEVLPEDESLGIGETLQLHAIGVFLFECRGSLTIDPNTQWKVLGSKPDRHVEVDSSGLVLGTSCGTSTVEAKNRGEAGTTTVTVNCSN
jgi:trimeric autotransporter adhesin